jgi:cephalosporin hydroxylase
MHKSKPSLWKQIPSCWFDFQDIYDEAVQTASAGSVLVEVGSFWGQSAVYLAEAAKIADKDLRVYAVDSWSMNPNTDPWLFDKTSKTNVEPGVHAEHHDSLFETMAHFVDRTGLSPDPLRIMRMDSLEAADLFTGRSPLHFVFLDGNHSYEYLTRELMEWEPLISVAGGMIAGHDYHPGFPGVKKAVDEYFGRSQAVEVKGRSWIVR